MTWLPVSEMLQSFLMFGNNFRCEGMSGGGSPVFTRSDCSLEMKGTDEGSIRNHPTCCLAIRGAQHLQGFPTLSFSAKVSNKKVPFDES